MRGSAGVASIVSLLGIVAACSSPLQVPSGSNSGPTVTFSALPVLSGSAAGVPETKIDGGVGQVTLQGAIGTELSCATVSGTAAVSGKRLDFTVTASQTEGCDAPADTFAYHGTVGNLTARTLDVFLIHVHPSAVDTVLSRTVTVR